LSTDAENLRTTSTDGCASYPASTTNYFPYTPLLFRRTIQSLKYEWAM